MNSRYLLLALILVSCNYSKTFKLFNEGAVEQDNFYQTIPFEMRIGVPIVTASINGKEGQFLFDTGAPNVVSSEFAEELALEERFQYRIKDSGGHVVNDQSYISIDSITLGDVTFTSTGGVAMGLKSSPIFRCLDIDGIIGANLMRQAFWKIDYQAEEISFSSSLDTFEVDSTFLTVDFLQRAQGTPRVDMMINGVVIKNLIFDTGSNQGLSMPTSALEKIRKRKSVDEIFAEGSTSYGVGGKDQSDTIFYAFIDSLAIGENLMNPEVIAFDKHSDTFGNEFFENFEVLLDWESSKIYLKPIAKQGSNLSTFGFDIELLEGALRVGSIYQKSSAEEYLQLGDTILQIDEYSIAQMSEEEICGLMVDRSIRFDDRDTLKIEIKRLGETKTFELQRRKLLPSK